MIRAILTHVGDGNSRGMGRCKLIGACPWLFWLLEDGAIISPIFLLAKRDSLDKTREIAQFLSGREVGEILAQKGLFPSLNLDVENVLPDCFSGAVPWKWLGWDYIYANNIAQRITQTEALFNGACELPTVEE